jgi:hypothetical protein
MEITTIITIPITTIIAAIGINVAQLGSLSVSSPMQKAREFCATADEVDGNKRSNKKEPKNKYRTVR